MKKSFKDTKILIAGGSGIVGTALKNHFSQLGSQVNILSRNASNPLYQWNPKVGKLNKEALEEADIIINLSGASIAGSRWTPAYKKELRDSRIESTALLIQNIQELQAKPRHFIQASAIGYYPNQSESVEESTPSGNDFLAQLTAEWEAEASKLNTENCLLSILRLGIVLSPKGGYVEKTSLPAKLGLSAGLGSGKQFISWVHIDDLTRLFAFVIENELSGIYNAVADEPVTNRTITKAMASALKRPYFLPNIPAPILKIMFGDLSAELLSNHHVSNQKIKDKGFVFQYPLIQKAFNQIFKK